MRWMPGVGLGEIDLRLKNLTRVVHKNVNHCQPVFDFRCLFICILVLFSRWLSMCLYDLMAGRGRVCVKLWGLRLAEVSFACVIFFNYSKVNVSWSCLFSCL